MADVGVVHDVLVVVEGEKLAREAGQIDEDRCDEQSGGCDQIVRPWPVFKASSSVLSVC
jgi:hypothetical protein